MTCGNSFGYRVATACAALLVLQAVGLAQFTPAGSTGARERVAGTLRLASGAPAPIDGDQLAAFFAGGVVSEVFQFTQETAESLEFSLVVYGDDPETDEVEGPAIGETVEFRFYRASTNTVYRRLGTLNSAGEAFNYQFNGLTLPDFIDGFPFPIDLIPTAPLDLRLTADPDSSGGAGGSGEDDDDGPGPPNYDVDGDGRVTLRDAAEVLRLMSGASIRVVSASRADVNRDGRVDLSDAIAVLRNRD